MKGEGDLHEELFGERLAGRAKFYLSDSQAPETHPLPDSDVPPREMPF